MRILLAHTYYKLPGGEDSVFATEAALLRQNGHEVFEYCQRNSEREQVSAAHLAARTVWSRSTYKELRGLIQKVKPEVCHFHNTFPLMSPSAFYAAKAERVPVVSTIHNYRLLCPAYTLHRGNQVCEKCTQTIVPWPAVRYACYRGNRGASAAVALMLAGHRMLGTWSKAVDVWIALTEFARDKFVANGFPPGRVVVKPNCVDPDPGFSADRDEFALFVGRLTEEKGVDILLKAWQSLAVPMPLRIAGNGPMTARVQDASARDPRIQYLGLLTKEQAREQMKRARVLIVPSIWYEGMPLTVVEAYATGTPVIVSGMGSMASLVTSGVTGLQFDPGEAQDLVSRLVWCWNNPGELAGMGKQGRLRYMRDFTAESHSRRILEIYEMAIARTGLLEEEAGQSAVIDNISGTDRSVGWGAARRGI